MYAAVRFSIVMYGSACLSTKEARGRTGISDLVYLIAHSRGGATRLFETIVPGYEGLETRQTRKMILIKIDLSLDRRFENYELPVRTFSGKQTTVPADLVHVGLDLLMHGVGRNALIFTARLTRG